MSIHRKGMDLIKAWEQRKKEAERATQNLRLAERQLTEWFLPDDAEEDEDFAMWVRRDNDTEKLIVIKIHSGAPVIRWRSSRKRNDADDPTP